MNLTIQKSGKQIASSVILAIALATPTAFARTSPSGAWAQPNESDLTSLRHYVSKYGQDVHSPAKTRSGAVPAGASAKCADGTRPKINGIRIPGLICHGAVQ
jgi:Protein of unknown function (DUF3761)